MTTPAEADYQRGMADAHRVSAGRDWKFKTMLLREALVCMSLADRGLSLETSGYSHGYLDGMKDELKRGELE